MIITPPHLLDGKRWSGMRVGLVGGSFNPPHEGHLHVSLMARRMLKLDYIWWLVTPQNPLKSSKVLEPFDKRLKMCSQFTAHTPHIIVTDIENQLGLSRTYETVSALRRIFSGTEFVWVGGMDLALNFHHWYRWRELLDLTATAFVARPPAWSLIENCPVRKISSNRHICLDRPLKGNLAPNNTYWILQRRMINISSTMLRESDDSTKTHL